MNNQKESLRKQIHDWFSKHPGKIFYHGHLQREFDLSTEQEKSNLRKILFRAKGEGIIRQLDQYGTYQVMTGGGIQILDNKKIMESLLRRRGLNG